MWTFCTIIFPFLMLIGVSALFGQWFLAGFWLTAFAGLGVWELIALKFKKMSITNLFKRWKNDPKNKWKAWVVAGAMWLAVGMIILHLMY